jgi:hypothetical protein
MKSLQNSIVLILFILIYSSTFSQQNTKNLRKPTAEKNIYGIQAGFLGAWAYNETRLYKSLTLRSELGFDLGLFGGSLIETSGSLDYVLAFNVTLEPRWYYNFKKRQEKSKRITNNNGNFVGIRVSSNFEDAVISDNDNVTIPTQIRIIPKWGIRRSIGEHFSYELGIGLGTTKTFNTFNDEWSGVLDLHIRFGFDF